MKSKYIKPLSIVLSTFFIASSLNISNVVVKADTNTLYDTKEQVPKEINGKKLIKVEEVIDKSDTEELNIVANHTFKYKYDLQHTIWKEENKRFNPNYSEDTGNLRWNVGVKDGNGNLIPYDSVWYKDYKVEMALISKSGTAKLDKEPFVMNGSPVTPLLVNGAIPDATAYFSGSGGIVSSWENSCWNSNKPKGFKMNTFTTPNYIKNQKGTYKVFNKENRDKALELYLPNPKNNYTLPACEYEPNPPSIMTKTYPQPTPPDSRVHKGIYATTNRVFVYGRVKYKGIYQGGSSTGGGGGDGEIKFNPYECEWTNEGKTGEGTGSYKVDVTFEGTNPVNDTGSCEVEYISGYDEDGDPIKDTRTESVPVEFPFDKMSVTGANGNVNEEINGTSGSVNITTEGENLELQAKGSWGEASYSEPSDMVGSVDLPSPPDEPSGQSGKYNIDWTKPSIDLDKAEDRWINSPVPYDVNVKVNDNLSGFNDSSKVIVEDYSHYGNNAEDSLPFGDKDYNKTIELDDGIYKIEVEATDRATNDNKESSEKYYIDGTKPNVNFTLSFNDRGNSDNGSNFAYFGKLTSSDNLSGVSRIEYAWTYGSDTPSDSEYMELYSHDITYEDRSDEEIEEKIEKPVGDNLYLHVKVWDCADNLTEETFGPYEDPIKLKDFEINDVRDPRWQDVFWKDDKYKEHTGKNYKVNQLPIDDKSHPTLANAFPKKGYAFYFNLTSEFMYREKDRIEIIPSFYYLKGNKRIPVDCYYNNNNNPLVKIGSSKDDVTLNLNTDRYGYVLIGNLNRLILTRGVRTTNGREWINGWKDEIQYEDGKEQWWYGKYFIPGTSVFVKHGDKPRPENILKDEKILINFQIIGYKNGVETLSSDKICTYVPSQWQQEGGSKQGYNDGDVILFDNKYSVYSDYETRVIQ